MTIHDVYFGSTRADRKTNVQFAIYFFVLFIASCLLLSIPTPLKAENQAITVAVLENCDFDGRTIPTCGFAPSDEAQPIVIASSRLASLVLSIFEVSAHPLASRPTPTSSGNCLLVQDGPDVCVSVGAEQAQYVLEHEFGALSGADAFD